MVETAKTRGLYRRKGSDFWWMAYGTGSGKAVRKSTGTKSKRKALQYLSKIRADIAEGRYLDVRRELKGTLGQLVDWYLSRPDAGVRDKFTCRPILGYFGPDRRFSDIDSKSIMDYQEFRLTETRRQGDKLVCERTINREIAFISALAGRAIKAGLAGTNPARGIKKFAERRRTRVLRASEIEALLAACREGPLYLYGLIFTAVTTGIRKGALLGLKWDDVDFVGGQLALQKTKGGYGRRVPLSEQTRRVLETMPRRSEYVFTSRTGGPLKDIRGPFRNACKRAKLEGVVFHTLRHCFGSLLAEQGVDAITIMNCLGHKSISTSLIYTHLSDGRLRQAMNLLPELSAQGDASKGDGVNGRVPESSHLVHIS